ncbi:hypothetical protein ACPA9J_03945 [Pseudomonas aeruginosa]
MEGGNGDVDIVAAIVTPGGACVHLISVRGGRVLGSRTSSAGRDRGGGRSAAGVPWPVLSQPPERDLPAEVDLNVTHEDFPVLVSAIAEARGPRTGDQLPGAWYPAHAGSSWR